MLLRHAPAGSTVDILFPSDPGAEMPQGAALANYDGLAWTGCSLCVTDESPEVQSQVDLQKKAFAEGVPGFGSCWAAQIAVVAAGGDVTPNPRGREMGLARKIHLTADGRDHPMYEGKPAVFDAFTSHDDEVTGVPDGARVLSSNAWTRVQSVHVKSNNTEFWGLQYHPEYDLYEMARLTWCRAEKLARLGFFVDATDCHRHVEKLEALHADPARKDLAWQLGIDTDVMDAEIRQMEVKNWIRSLLVLFVVLASPALAQFNYDEAKVPKYTLPDPLLCAGGTRVTTREQWTKTRRPELLRAFERHVYGRMPGRPAGMRFETRGVQEDALGGAATRKEIVVHLGPGDQAPKIEILLWVPNAAAKPAPAFLGLNFYGNASTHADPGITLSTQWTRNNKKFGVVKNRATNASRGVRQSRWPAEMIIARGYALATVFYGDIDPDFHDGFANGVHPLFPMKGEAGRAPDAWGSISAWAWGLSRALDALDKDPDIDGTRVAVVGHSRLGKTALWAGASDPRFALVISNDSGCGGAALSRRAFGETVARINQAFPHWFCRNFHRFGGREGELPVDQHQLIALCAPRPCLVSSAAADGWADPRGEFLSLVGAHPVYALFGTNGLPDQIWPKPGTTILGALSYHLRPGKHDATSEDWKAFLACADRHLAKK
ncbi:MAG: hypothetical protein CMJ83_05180 [Planctomycetes bacterium]|nr:hypothetical protein [Planctomycetota bacterium]